MAPIRRIVTKPLGELLIERGVINRKQLEHALRIQKERSGLLGQILTTLGYTNEEEIAQAITIQYGLPYLPLSGYDIDPEGVKIIPEQVARQYGLIVIDKIGETITLAMSNPLNIQALEDVEFLTKCKVQTFVSTLSDVNDAINKHYGKK